MDGSFTVTSDNQTVGKSRIGLVTADRHVETWLPPAGELTARPYLLVGTVGMYHVLDPGFHQAGPALALHLCMQGT